MNEGLSTREKVRKMTAEGFKTREVATALGVSTQRVNKIKQVLKAIEEDQREHSAS